MYGARAEDSVELAAHTRGVLLLLCVDVCLECAGYVLLRSGRELHVCGEGVHACSVQALWQCLAAGVLLVCWQVMLVVFQVCFVTCVLLIAMLPVNFVMSVMVDRLTGRWQCWCWWVRVWHAIVCSSLCFHRCEGKHKGISCALIRVEPEYRLFMCC
jgi:hypothetical protein